MRSVLTVWFVLQCSVAVAQDFTGTVIKVHDGDTAHVKKADGTVVKVRFLLVDTPEIDQPHGTAARDFVADKILGNVVTVKANGVDMHGRALGEIIYMGENINRSLIEQGHGWWFYHYHSDKDVGELEVQAKVAKKGLWAHQNPIYPRNWRAGARTGGGASGGGNNNGNGGSTSPNVTSRVYIMGAMPNPYESDPGHETILIANRDSKAVSIDGWKAEDDDGGSFALTGSIPAGGVLTFRLDASLQLGNGGDTIILKNAANQEVHRLSYTSAAAGRFVMSN